MKTLHYAGARLTVTDELAETLLAASMEFADDDRTFRVPVACRIEGRSEIAQLVLGPGIPLLVVDAPDAEADAGDPPGSESAVALIVELMESLVGDDD
ncbi:hypothetical protein SOM11_04340 [Frigoribacterium sp. CFBP9039]|uniref:hypothetical protein n=1 Tax=Frigoribacterium TaxID=96492 RepID=UPI00178646CA|nr:MULTISPECIES: hypothetical protein [Frigoribacterium]MBD8703659.1 hypothetical protein [Frigoribacterium sp. CFBP 13712]MCJ0701153.1 hypothetical protein [Frigoribacterium faeni]MDY0890830.1 hypothetical protein [Frigoribacterium sp. CFBP9030]MDY0945210.1 hypothetical protein [Frigoribacterium sp. CFBP9039]